MKQISEWPFEGRLKFLFRTGARRVGLVGNRTRLLRDIPENSRWWDCCMKQISEWPFEGRLKFLFRTGARRVGLVGNRTRYQSGVYVST